jgi:hypothetical protein
LTYTLTSSQFLAVDVSYAITALVPAFVVIRSPRLLAAEDPFVARDEEVN